MKGHESKMEGNECKMKSDERKCKQKMTLDQGCFHPQKAGKITLLVYRELTT